jgi:hypothetical protein
MSTVLVTTATTSTLGASAQGRRSQSDPDALAPFWREILRRAAITAPSKPVAVTTARTGHSTDQPDALAKAMLGGISWRALGAGSRSSACREDAVERPGPPGVVAIAFKRRRTWPGRAVARAGVPGVTWCPPVAEGMFSQYWLIALGEVSEQLIPGASDAPAAAGAGSASAIERTPARIRAE